MNEYIRSVINGRKIAINKITSLKKKLHVIKMMLRFVELVKCKVKFINNFHVSCKKHIEI
jgi:hypothetical protein